MSSTTRSASTAFSSRSMAAAAICCAAAALGAWLIADSMATQAAVDRAVVFAFRV